MQPNILTKFVRTDLEKQRTRILLEILVKMDQKTPTFMCPLDRYENQLDNLDDMCLADFAANYI